MTTDVSASPEKLDFKRILPIFVIVLVDLLGLTIIIPILPLYAVRFQADPFVIGMLAATYPLMQLIGGPLLGGLSDRFGRKPVLIASQFGTFIGFIILGLSNSLLLLFLSRIIDGLSGANIVTAQAAITDSTTEKTRSQGLGLIGAAFGLGFTIGPVIAIIALQLGGGNYQVPAFVAAGFSFFSIILSTLWFKETHPAEKRGEKNASRGIFVLGNLKRMVKNPFIALLLGLMFMQHLIFNGVESLLSLFTLNRLGMSGSWNAILFLLIGVILVAIQGKYIGQWTRRFGERKLIYSGMGLLAIGLVFLAITPAQTVPNYSREGLIAELQGAEVTDNTDQLTLLPPDGDNGWSGVIWIVLVMFPVTIGASVLSPSINSLITQNVSQQEVGVALGVSASLMSAGNVIMPLLGGAIFQLFGGTTLFLMGGLVMGIICLYSFRALNPSGSLVTAKD
ncbi:MAG: MFS transporter [Phototrophicales bacterium]|nr:MFS transporter [Phototrophicales bacterium]